MRSSLRTLLPVQFSILSLLLLTTLVAIVLGVVCLPSSVPEKISILVVLWQCLWCWRNRNYLHPLQGTIPYAVRRRMAIADFVGTAFIWPPLFIWLYFWRDYRSSHALWSDAVFCGSLALLFAIATWKLIRGLQRRAIWKNLI